jgi:phage shock protein PspC (stress-responsive transcriptional regulator)
MEQNSNGGFDRGQLKDVQSWRRSRSDRMVAGVCGGMARALNVDPVLVRVVMAVLVISGPGLLFYVAAWVLMPDEGSDRSAAQGLLGDRVRPDHPWLWPVVIGACVFVAIAMMSSFNFGKLIPGPLVVLGLLWLFVFRRKGGRSNWSNRRNWSAHGGNWTGRPVDPDAPTTSAPTTQYQAAPGSPQYQAAPQTGPLPPPAGPSSSATQRPQDRVTEPVQPVWTEDDPLGLYVDEPPAATAATRTPAAPPVKGYRGVKPAIVVLTGLAIAIAWAAGATTPMMLVIGLITLGLGMLFGGFLGRTLALLPIGILLALGIAASTLFPSIPRDFVDRNFVADTTTKIDATNTKYNFDAGSVHLDLTNATFDKGAKVVVAGVVGEVVVKLPPNVDAFGTVSTKVGEVDAFGQKQSGHSSQLTLANLGADHTKGPQEVELDLHLKLGSITVERG